MSSQDKSHTSQAVSHRSVLKNPTDTTCERPVPVVTSRKFKYIMHNTKQLFTTRGFQDMELSVIAVTGRSTRGKSLILNYLLRYANFRYVFNQHAEEWLHDGDLPCAGWKWQEDDNSASISVWSDFFIFETPEKRKAAILILATDGITNKNADSCEAHAILGLATLCSSVQVHTIQTRIQDDDLDDMELATMYAALIANKTQEIRTNRFQKLICVVSGWPTEDDAFGGLGFAGGWEYFLKEGSHSRKIKVHDHIKEYYSEIRGFLMPESGDPEGGLKHATLIFKETVKQLAENILAPENVKLKTINGKHMKVGDLFKCIELWVMVLNGPEAPIVHLGYKTSVQLQNMIAKEAAYRAYNRYMIEVFSSRRHIPKDVLEFNNQRAIKSALVAYDRIPKLHSHDQHEEELKEELAVLYGTYVAKNQHRTTWYYLTYDAIYQTLQDTSYTVWLVMFLAYYALEKLEPKSRTISRMLLQQGFKQKTTSLIDVKIKDHGEDHQVTYHLNTKEIKKLMAVGDYRNMKVAVISVAGKSRSGKSFILDFFLRYAKHKYVLKKPDKGWMGPKDKPLREGFSWSHGKERDTVGIQIWPQFFISNVRGERVCIILMDTQGSHDNESTWQEMAGIFSLSAMTSSLQIYNVRNRIDDADLSHLEKFCAYAGTFSKSGLKPFQKMLFLVRDWGMYDFHEYGFEGGYDYLKDTVFREVKEPERLKTRHNVRTYFEDMACFLMPEPGEAAKGLQGFEGQLNDLSDIFIQQLDQFIPSVLMPENLVLKQVNGEPVTVELLFHYLKWWVERFNSANISVMTVMVNTTTEVKRLQVKNDALTIYADEMDQFCKSRLHFAEKELFANHVLAKEAALSYFNKEAVIADEATIRIRHKQTLLEDIDSKYAECKTDNSHKLFQRDRVVYLPCIAVPIITVCYLIHRNCWMRTGAPYLLTIALFWMSVAVMGYWVMIIFSWLVTGCTRCTVNTLFWVCVATQVYNLIVG